MIPRLKTALPLLLAVSGCATAVEPADRAPLTPPAEYRVWWDATRECVGQANAEFERVRWWTATDVLKEKLASGLWVKRHDIYIRPDKIQSEVVVRHEMIHDLLQRGDHGSPFYRSCSGPG